MVEKSNEEIMNGIRSAVEEIMLRESKKYEHSRLDGSDCVCNKQELLNINIVRIIHSMYNHLNNATEEGAKAFFIRMNYHTYNWLNKFQKIEVGTKFDIMVTNESELPDDTIEVVKKEPINTIYIDIKLLTEEQMHAKFD